jgi:tetratricopeptide (TPR) repeat protein
MSEPSKSLSQQSADCLQQGQALEARGRFEEALSCYDQAIAMMRSAPVSDDAARRQLGLAWMNRGNTLQQLGNAVSVANAVSAYDEAIAVLQTLPFASNPIFRNHLGAAWLNRGHALLLASDDSGITSFEQAVAHLEKLPIDADPYYRLNLAGAWTNLAHATLASAPARANAAAHSALSTVKPAERAHEAFAMMSLRARRALIMALGEQLRAAESAQSPTTDLLSEATDAVDDGLALAREFALHGSPEFRALAARIFRLGAQLYGRHQPHFLGEFLLEQVASPAFVEDAEVRAVAEQALARALAEVQRPQLFVVDTAAATKALATAQAIRTAQRQLSILPPLPTKSVSTFPA